MSVSEKGRETILYVHATVRYYILPNCLKTREDLHVLPQSGN